MSGRRPNLLYKSFHHRKKIFYVLFSILLSTGLIIADVYDITVLMTLQRPDITTHRAVDPIMILHIVSFYLSLLGFVHSLEVKLYNLVKIALAAGGLSLLSILIKLTKELMLAGFFRTEYAVT